MEGGLPVNQPARVNLAFSTLVLRVSGDPRSGVRCAPDHSFSRNEDALLPLGSSSSLSANT